VVSVTDPYGRIYWEPFSEQFRSFVAVVDEMDNQVAEDEMGGSCSTNGGEGERL
jgi:hypothetical protein